MVQSSLILQRKKFAGKTNVDDVFHDVTWLMRLRAAGLTGPVTAAERSGFKLERFS